MCRPKVKAAPPAPPPAAAPPPPAQAATQVQGDVARDENLEADGDLRAKRKGRNSLRIRLDASNPGGGAGLNIPQA